MRGLRSFILFYQKLVERTSLDRGVKGYGVCYLFEVLFSSLDAYLISFRSKNFPGPTEIDITVLR